MKIPKIKWKVSPKPEMSWRFDKREWPYAEYADGQLASWIDCEDEYVPRFAKCGEHAPLKVLFRDYSFSPSIRCSLTNRFDSLAEAKCAFAECLAAHPEVAPKELAA